MLYITSKGRDSRSQLTSIRSMIQYNCDWKPDRDKSKQFVHPAALPQCQSTAAESATCTALWEPIPDQRFFSSAPPHRPCANTSKYRALTNNANQHLNRQAPNHSRNGVVLPQHQFTAAKSAACTTPWEPIPDQRFFNLPLAINPAPTRQDTEPSLTMLTST